MIWHILLTHLKQVEILYHDWFNDLKSKHFLRNKMHRHYIQTLLWWLSLQLKTLKFPQDRSEGGSWMFGISPIWGRRSTELKVKTKARPSAFRQMQRICPLVSVWISIESSGIYIILPVDHNNVSISQPIQGCAILSLDCSLRLFQLVDVEFLIQVTAEF